MKKAILISAHGSDSWIGGVYYRKNIMFSLLHNEYVKNNFNIIVATSEKLKSVYSDLPGEYKLYIEKDKKTMAEKIKKFLFLLSNNVRYIFPSDHYEKRKWTGFYDIYWIADFQHHYYPEYFKSSDIQQRIVKEKRIENSLAPLVLSSKDSRKFFISQYSKKNVYVVPFVSYIEPIINKIDLVQENTILKKYGLNKERYTCIMNQFWKHKNHKIVLEAMEKYFFENPKANFEFVFTGKVADYRNPEYAEEIKRLLCRPILKQHIKMLGFIEREDQIAIMKNAAFVIQPSLFEGWGTVVEDAKVLDKTILLSDIPVHREQKNDKCILFDPHDPVALASLIEEEVKKEHHDDVKTGIADMYKRAEEYSKGFEQLLRDLERE